MHGALFVQPAAGAQRAVPQAIAGAVAAEAVMTWPTAAFADEVRGLEMDSNNTIIFVSLSLVFTVAIILGPGLLFQTTTDAARKNKLEDLSAPDDYV